MAMTQFTVLNEKRSLKEITIKFFIGFLAVLYLGLLFGAAYTPDVSLAEWFNNFYEFVFVERHFIVLAFTEGSFKTILLLEGIWCVVFMISMTKIQHPYAGSEYGDAKWGTAKEFTKIFGNHDKENEVVVNFGDCPKPGKPVIVNTKEYWLAEGVYLNIDNKLTSNLNIEVIGPPGTGKSFRLVRPFLAQLAGSYLVTDPKGELSQQTGQYMEDNGYGVFIIDCESETGMRNSHHFNPFKYIENESDILGLCEILFRATKDPDAQTGDQFFEDMAQVLLNCIFYLMHYTYTDDEKDWPHFVELLNADAAKADPATGGIDISDPNCLMQRFIRANDKWKETHNGENLKGFEDVEKIYTGAQETASSIVSSLDSHTKYMKLDCVVDLLSNDDLDFINTFGYAKKTNISSTGKYILYMVTSESVRHFDWIPSMIYSLFIDKLYQLTKNDESLHQTLPQHLTFLMDEFNNVTLPDKFVDLTSTMRSRGMSVVMIIQNLLQLKNKFPKNDQDKNLRANMSTTIVLGGPDKEVSCKTLSEEFGKHTIHKQTTGLTKGTQGSSSENEDVMEHYLFPADKIYGMSKDGPCAIHVKGADPLWVNKVQFQNSPLLPLLTRRNPYKIKKSLIEKPKPYDYTKSPIEQLPDIYFGKEAEDIIKKCNAEGIKVATLSELDIDAVAVLSDSNMPIQGKDATTEEFWRNVYKNTAIVLEEERKNELNFDVYSNEQIITVQLLKNNGFSGLQINALNGLINKNYTFEEITKFFNPNMSEQDILEFCERFLKIKEKEGKENE